MPQPTAPHPDPQTRRLVRRCRWLAMLLDSAVPVPGTRYRFGIDPLLGIVPVVGDAISAALSLYIVAAAHRLGVPLRTRLLMLAAIAFDFLLGSVPVLGDAFDFAFNANLLNVRLMERALRRMNKLDEADAEPVGSGFYWGDVITPRVKKIKSRVTNPGGI